MLKEFFSFVFELIKIIVVSLMIIIPIRYFLIQPFYVKGASMEPNFHDHEYLIVDEISYRFNEPQRGDVIVFKYPRNPQEYFIKRIIALPGEKIQIKNGEVYIYNSEFPEGQVLSEDYLEGNTRTYNTNENIVYLEDDEYYVLGDNRNSSKDSRSFGAVKDSFVIGRVFFRGWPLEKIEVFSSPIYQY